MKKENIQLKLVDSTYGKEEAREILLRLITDKIKFLGQKEFSLKERFGIDSEHFEGRLAQLRKEREELIEYFELLKTDDVMVQIECPINVTLVNRNESEVNQTISKLATS